MRFAKKAKRAGVLDSNLKNLLFNTLAYKFNVSLFFQKGIAESRNERPNINDTLWECAYDVMGAHMNRENSGICKKISQRIYCFTSTTSVVCDHSARIRRALHPCILSMTLMGLAHSKSRPAKWYSRLLLVLFWLNFFRHFSWYNEKVTYGYGFFFKFVIHIWAFQCAVSATVCYIFFSRYFQEFLRFGTKWNLGNDHYVYTYARKLSTYVSTLTPLCWLAISVYVTIFAAYLVVCEVVPYYQVDSISAQSSGSRSRILDLEMP